MPKKVEDKLTPIEASVLESIPKTQRRPIKQLWISLGAMDDRELQNQIRTAIDGLSEKGYVDRTSRGVKLVPVKGTRMQNRLYGTTNDPERAYQRRAEAERRAGRYTGSLFIIAGAFFIILQKITLTGNVVGQSSNFNLPFILSFALFVMGIFLFFKKN